MKRIFASMFLLFVTLMVCRPLLAQGAEAAQPYVATEEDKSSLDLLHRWAKAAKIDLMWLSNFDFPIEDVDGINRQAYLAEVTDLGEAAKNVLKVLSNKSEHRLVACMNDVPSTLVVRNGWSPCKNTGLS